MTCRELLEVLANVASIATASLAAVFTIWLWCRNYKRRIVLENHLRDERAKDRLNGKNGQRSFPHLIAKVGLTENQILEASFQSKHIARRVKVDDVTNLAKDLLFEYVE